eukprot:s855_g5.t1
MTMNHGLQDTSNPLLSKPYCTDDAALRAVRGALRPVVPAAIAAAAAAAPGEGARDQERQNIPATDHEMKNQGVICGSRPVRRWSGPVTPGSGTTYLGAERHTDSTAGTLVATLFLFEKQAVLELFSFTSDRHDVT